MKGWVKNLAIVFLLSSTSSMAHAQSSIVEYPLAGKKLAAPVIMEDSEDQPISESLSRSATEHQVAHRTPYVVEFGRVAQPVSLQPPTIRPTGLAPHVQEFGVSPVETFENDTMSAPVIKASALKGGSSRKISRSTQSSNAGRRPIHVSSQRSSSQLVPVTRLAIFPLGEQRSSSVTSHFAASESNNLISGKSRPSL
jgi:hypothetical protein